MIYLISTLLLGFLVGWVYRKLDRFKPIITRLYSLTVVLLLFSMGVTVGANRSLITELPTIGLNAFMFTIATIAGTIILTLLIIRLNLLPSK